MKHVTIVVPDGEGNNLSSIVGAYKILTRADELLEAIGEERCLQGPISRYFRKHYISLRPLHCQPT